ncbi:TatD family deoxyribonuclease [Candidatus Bathyarchaeota archaeon]|nr:TatD family deoxyribonuclease [Candidatus Bathyarchaeota archaeon]
MFVDTHAHLQWGSFDVDRKDVLERAREKRVTRIVNIGFDLAGCLKGVKLAENHKEFYATVGIHPHSANALNNEIVDKLRELAAHPKVVAIGEIGLDYYRNLSPREAQRQAFEAQLALAQEIGLPVVIHDREAHDDILQALLRFKGKVKGVMHCFSGNKEMAQQCMDLGFKIAFNGTITYPKNHELREIVEWIDLKSMLLETDCPWLAPQEVRGKRNEPSFLSMIAREIANLKRISVDYLAETTTRNAEEILKLTATSCGD